MLPCVVNYASGPYVKGQKRLQRELLRQPGQAFQCWTDVLPPQCPPQAGVPYAFKAFAMHWAASAGADRIMWLDACMVPLRSLEPIWKHAEEHGVWLHENGFSNYEWTADDAYPALFPEFARSDLRREWPRIRTETYDIDAARGVNRKIPHVVGGAIAVDLRHATGRSFLSEYFRLASETRAFCGPWSNANHPDHHDKTWRPNSQVAPCGPADVRGHRHDQTAASVLAWRYNVPLTKGPEVLAYGLFERGAPGGPILLADGAY